MAKGKILIVDDSDLVLNIVLDWLSSEGYEVFMAPNGMEALNLTIQEKPDLIISDIDMPIMNGWELCEHVRTNPATTSIPFIFLTSHAEAPDKIQGLKMGADDYLTKPFSPDQLITRVNAILEAVRKAREEVNQHKVLSGRTSGISLADLLQVFEAGKKTGVLRITNEQEGAGRIYIRDGAVHHALLGSLYGVEAIYKMLEWTDAEFVVEPFLGGEIPRTIHEKVQAIVLESARLLDERSRASRA